MPREPMTDIIVLLPGIGGSVLKKDGRDLWALSGEPVPRKAGMMRPPTTLISIKSVAMPRRLPGSAVAATPSASK